jgi:hypothetical protein
MGERFSSTYYSCISYLRILEINRKDDISKEAQPYRIKKDNEQLEYLKSLIRSCRNPFDECESELFNINTGKAASKEVSDSF